MRFRTPSSVAAILALVFFVVGSVERPSALQAQEPLQIAWAGPLTGDVAQLGQGWLNGVKLALDEWNAKGGVLGRKVVVAREGDHPEGRRHRDLIRRGGTERCRLYADVDQDHPDGESRCTRLLHQLPHIRRAHGEAGPPAGLQEADHRL